MHVVEVSLGEGSAMSHSGVQVEYVPAGRVMSVEPSFGVVSGGTIVTLSGEGFVAGRTACRFGSAESTEAEVLSSSEAQCVVPAAAVGSVSVYVSTSTMAGVWQESGLQYKHVDAVSVRHLSPLTANTGGGLRIHVFSCQRHCDP